MKTILIPTDFSDNSKQAALYGYLLAGKIKADVLLCNAMIIPAEIPQAGLMAWPVREFDELLLDGERELNTLKNKLLSTASNSSFKPNISCYNEAGNVCSVVNSLIAHNEIDFVVIGTHTSNGLTELIMGNHARVLIDNSTRPLLLIPSHTVFKPIEKIAFATDFKNIDEDLATIYQLIPIAKTLCAEISVTHIASEKYDSFKLQKALTTMSVELSNKVDYPNIYYRLIKNKSVELGLQWLSEHSQVDMLVMAHRHHGFWDNIFNMSHAKRISDHISIPLLVFPPNNKN